MSQVPGGPATSSTGPGTRHGPGHHASGPVGVQWPLVPRRWPRSGIPRSPEPGLPPAAIPRCGRVLCRTWIPRSVQRVAGPIPRSVRLAAGRGSPDPSGVCARLRFPRTLPGDRLRHPPSREPWAAGIPRFPGPAELLPVGAAAALTQLSPLVRTETSEETCSGFNHFRAASGPVAAMSRPARHALPQRSRTGPSWPPGVPSSGDICFIFNFFALTDLGRPVGDCRA